ncbi:TonB-dependent receptor [uncultured Sphingomonas sp.]|uniref:TonB-dependent receptor n=1 Tax=uncultured Sphingomonas sp. TaxID=158754 RepID=UPI0035C9CA6A
MRSPSSFLILSCAVAATPALAADPVPADEPDQVVVTGRRDGYVVDSTGSATRVDTAVRDIPQAVSAISETQIEDRNFRSVGDVLRAVPGASAAQGEGHRDQIVLRGNNSTADFFVDGLRDDAQYYRPLYNLDRLEVLRGPNAMTFGRGGGGGVVNRVTKRAGFQTFGVASGSADGFGAWSVDADANLALAEGIGARLNAVREEFANHRDVFAGRVYAVNPTVRALVGPRTDATLSYEYVDDARVVDRGVPSVGGRPVRGYRDTFFGVRRVNRLGLEAHLARGTLEHRFSDEVAVVGRLLYGNYDKFYRNVFPATAVDARGAVGMQAYDDAQRRENLLGQTDLTWAVSTGPVAHVVLAGVEAGEQRTRSARLNGFFDGEAGTTMGGRQVSVPLAERFAAPTPVFRRGTGERTTRSTARFQAVLLQDKMTAGPVELLAGLRFDRFELKSVNLLNSERFERTDELWSPRLGLVMHPVAPVSIYLSYSRSYLPQSGDQFASLDLTSAALKPERFENVEAGAKWEPRPSLLLAAAMYRLDRTNTRNAGPNPGEVLLTGEQRSRGVELEATGRVRPNLLVTLGYALQEAEIRRTTAAAPAGRSVALVPKHQLSAWGRWDVSGRLGVGVGVEHRSKQFTSISNAVTLPDYTRVDLGVFFRLSERVEAQVNVENLFDTGYFPTAHSDNNISTGAPINARATVRVRL